MNKCYFQRWEESERNWGIRPDGCSLHLNSDLHEIFLAEIYDNRKKQIEIPKEYDKVVGPLIDCFISDELYIELQKKSNLRLMEYEMNNLIKTEEIIFKP